MSIFSPPGDRKQNIVLFHPTNFFFITAATNPSASDFLNHSHFILKKKQKNGDEKLEGGNSA